MKYVSFINDDPSYLYNLSLSLSLSDISMPIIRNLAKEI
jgi:hypothetical protein